MDTLKLFTIVSVKSTWPTSACNKSSYSYQKRRSSKRVYQLKVNCSMYHASEDANTRFFFSFELNWVHKIRTTHFKHVCILSSVYRQLYGIRLKGLRIMSVTKNAAINNIEPISRLFMLFFYN